MDTIINYRWTGGYICRLNILNIQHNNLIVWEWDSYISRKRDKVCIWYTCAAELCLLADNDHFGPCFVLTSNGWWSEWGGGRERGAAWLVPGLSLLRSVSGCSQGCSAQIPISEQFNIPHQAVSRQIVSLTRAGMLVMIIPDPGHWRCHSVFLSFMSCHNIPLRSLGGAMSQLEMNQGSVGA